MLAVVLLATVWAAGNQSEGPAPGGSGTDAVRLGPTPGEDVGAYLSRVRDVAPGPGPRAALVQFDAPTPTGGVPAVPGVAGEGVTAVQAVLRAPLPRVQTALYREDLARGDAGGAVADARARAATAAAGRAARTPPGRSRDVAAAEARALGDPGCGCLLALVVELDPGRVAALARAPGVRAVQVAPPGTGAGRLAVSPLLPEQGPGRPDGPVVGPVPDDGPVPAAP